MSDNTSSENPVMQVCMACKQTFNALMFSCPHCGTGGSSMMAGGFEMFDIMTRKQESTELNDKAAKIYQQGNVSEAVNLLKKALETNPMNEKAHENLGIVLLQEGRLEEARGILEKVLNFNPRREEARRYLAEVKSKLGPRSPKPVPQSSQPQTAVTAVPPVPQKPARKWYQFWG